MTSQWKIKKGTEKLKKPEAFLDYSQTIDDVYGYLEDYDMEANKNLSTELFFRGRKRNISFVFISQYYFKVPKTLRLNAKNKQKRTPTIASTHLSDIELKDFMNLYKDYTKEPFSFLVNDTTLPSDNSLRFRKNLL